MCRPEIAAVIRTLRAALERPDDPYATLVYVGRAVDQLVVEFGVSEADLENADNLPLGTEDFRRQAEHPGSKRRRKKPELHNPNRLVGFAELQELTGLSRSTIERKVHAGTFPRPVRAALGRVLFVSSEVDEWIAARKSERGGSAL